MSISRRAPSCDDWLEVACKESEAHKMAGGHHGTRGPSPAAGQVTAVTAKGGSFSCKGNSKKKWIKYAHFHLAVRLRAK